MSSGMYLNVCVAGDYVNGLMKGSFFFFFLIAVLFKGLIRMFSTQQAALNF